MASFLLTPILRIEAAASGKIEKNKIIVHSTAMDASTDTASRRFLNLFTLPGTSDAVLEKLDNGEARPLFATGVPPICKMINNYFWPPKIGGQIRIFQVPSPVSFCILFKDKRTIIVATNYWNCNSCTVSDIGGKLFRTKGLSLRKPGAIVANGRDVFFVVDDDDKHSPPSINAFRVLSVTDTETATAIVTEIEFVKIWSRRLEVPGIGRIWNPVSLTFARDHLVVAIDGYHTVKSVSAWNPETGDFNSILLVNPRDSGRLNAVLAIDSEYMLMIDEIDRGSYRHRLHRLRLRVLKWSDRAAQASVVYTTEIPCDQVYDISAVFMPLSDFAPNTATGNIYIADGENSKLYVFSWHPNELDMILFKEVIVDSALLKEPSDIAYYKGVIMVLNTHRKCTSSRCTIPSGVYIIRVAAPCPPALTFKFEE